MDTSFAIYFRKSPRHNWHLHSVGTQEELKGSNLSTLKNQCQIFRNAGDAHEFDLFSFDATLQEWELPTNIRNIEIFSSPVVEWVEHL